jgi:hypothetical protein
MTTYDIPPETTQKPRISLVGAIPKDATPQDRPDYPRASLDAMRKRWELGDLLLGGTDAMHDAAEKVLHRETGETPDEFRVRLGRGVLTNYYGDTIERHSALPFRTEIKFDPPLPDSLRYLETNCDGSGRSITVLAREMMREGMHRGLTHLLVDAPPVDPNAASLRDDLTRRPLLLHIKPSDMLDAWDEPTASQDGEEQVIYARIAQTRLVESGQFGKSEQPFVLELDTAAKVAREWTQNKDSSWDMTESPYTRPGIPLFTFYTHQTDSYAAEPAYRYLAELNLAHFQSDVEQRHGLSYGRRSTTVKTGWKDRSAAQQVAAGQAAPQASTTLGFARQITSEAPDAKAYFLETGGAGLAAGEVDLQSLERRMERFGAAQVSRDGGITATSRALDDKRDNCNLEAWCTRLESRILAAVRAIAAWRKVPLPAGQKVLFDRSFAEEQIGPGDLPYLIQMAEKGMLPRSVLVEEARLRKVLRTSYTPDEIRQMLADEEQQFAEASMEALVQQQIAARGPQPPVGQPPQADPAAPPTGAPA